MKETQLHKYIKLAMEADIDGDYKSADEIDNFIKQAQNPLQTGWRSFVNRMRGMGDETGRARRQVRDLRRGPNTVDRMRSQPSYDEALGLLEDGKNISGHNPMVLRSNSTLTDRIINALQPTYRQVQTKQKELPELYEKWKAIYDAKIAELKTRNGLSDDQIDDWLDNNPRERENLVSPLESQLVRMRDAHATLIENAIDQVCSSYQIPRNMENLNQIKARIASDRQLRGMLYDNSFTTDSMIEQVLQNSTIPMRSYLNNMGPWKRSMSPAVTGLLFLGAGAVGGAALKGQSQPQSPKGLSASPFVGVLTNELLADRKKAKLFDTPIETMEKYIKRKKGNGSIKPGITKKELYNMALIDLGEHVANNLIQYVMDKYGFTIPKDSTEKDFVVNLFK
jgi:hypothetical protein